MKARLTYSSPFVIDYKAVVNDWEGNDLFTLDEEFLVLKTNYGNTTFRDFTEISEGVYQVGTEAVYEGAFNALNACRGVDFPSFSIKDIMSSLGRYKTLDEYLSARKILEGESFSFQKEWGNLCNSEWKVGDVVPPVYAWKCGGYHYVVGFLIFDIPSLMEYTIEGLTPLIEGVRLGLEKDWEWGWIDLSYLLPHLEKVRKREKDLPHFYESGYEDLFDVISGCLHPETMSIYDGRFPVVFSILGGITSLQNLIEVDCNPESDDSFVRVVTNSNEVDCYLSNKGIHFHEEDGNLFVRAITTKIIPNRYERRSPPKLMVEYRINFENGRIQMNLNRTSDSHRMFRDNREDELRLFDGIGTHLYKSLLCVVNYTRYNWYQYGKETSYYGHVQMLRKYIKSNKYGEDNLPDMVDYIIQTELDEDESVDRNRILNRIHTLLHPENADPSKAGWRHLFGLLGGVEKVDALVASTFNDTVFWTPKRSVPIFIEKNGKSFIQGLLSHKKRGMYDTFSIEVHIENDDVILSFFSGV